MSGGSGAARLAQISGLLFVGALGYWLASGGRNPTPRRGPSAKEFETERQYLAELNEVMVATMILAVVGMVIGGIWWVLEVWFT